jgi:hypothetical protein
MYIWNIRNHKMQLWKRSLWDVRHGLGKLARLFTFMTTLLRHFLTHHSNTPSTLRSSSDLWMGERKDTLTVSSITHQPVHTTLNLTILALTHPHPTLTLTLSLIHPYHSHPGVGYILAIFRISHGRNSSSTTSGQPVILQHGLWIFTIKVSVLYLLTPVKMFDLVIHKEQ